MTDINYPEYLTRQEASKYLTDKGCPICTGTLAKWASNKSQSLPFVKVGRWVRYKRTDIDAWLEKQYVNK